MAEGNSSRIAIGGNFSQQVSRKHGLCAAWVTGIDLKKRCGDSNGNDKLSRWI